MVKACALDRERADNLVTGHDHEAYAAALTPKNENLHNNESVPLTLMKCPLVSSMGNVKLDRPLIDHKRDSEMSSVLVVKGTGHVAAIVRASLKFARADQTTEEVAAQHLEYTCHWQRGGLYCNFTIEFDIAGLDSIRCNSAIVSEENGLNIRISNGFSNCTLSLPRMQGETTKNVAFFGHAGHGKSQLIEALCAHCSNTGGRPERVEFDFKVSDDEEARSFMYNDQYFYEMPAFEGTPDVWVRHQKTLQRYPPTVVVIVLDAGAKYTYGGLCALVKSMFDDRNKEIADKLTFVLVFTKCPPFTPDNSRAETIKRDLGLPNARHAFVNSIDRTIEHRGGSITIEAQGIPELWEILSQTQMRLPIPGLRLAGFWAFVYAYTAPHLSRKNAREVVSTVIGGLALLNAIADQLRQAKT